MESREQFYEAPVTEVIEVRMKGILNSSLDGSRSDYGVANEQEWN